MVSKLLILALALELNQFELELEQLEFELEQLKLKLEQLELEQIFGLKDLLGPVLLVKHYSILVPGLMGKQFKQAFKEQKHWLKQQQASMGLELKD